MSSPSSSPRTPDLEAWVENARTNPVQYRQRQVTHILLHAIARTDVLRNSLCLKGGTLMSTVYGSLRQTGDVDFTSTAAPEPFASNLTTLLNNALAAAAADLGYVDLRMQVQKFDRQPRFFEKALAPALQMTIGIAAQEGRARERLEQGNAIETLAIDISFKEPVINLEVVEFGRPNRSVFAYSTEELIAEKLRALAQQKIRNRSRRQDVYDICWLIGNVPLDEAARARILEAFLEKADARDMNAGAEALDDPEIRERAGANWQSMVLEIGELPDFDEQYERVRTFFRQLPWSG